VFLLLIDFEKALVYISPVVGYSKAFARVCVYMGVCVCMCVGYRKSYISCSPNVLYSKVSRVCVSYCWTSKKLSYVSPLLMHIEKFSRARVYEKALVCVCVCVLLLDIEKALVYVSPIDAY
jgi:hypothetical protein